ncbi:MAG: cell division protein FtsK [Desulfobacterales bacterium CG2_30_60_27]|nr:MAG: cell division protein FtsK [Desulfobacterales bacterium CG2_30_60_27]
MVKNRKIEERPPLGQEILAVVGICVALFLFLCLASYTFTAEPFHVSPGSLGNWGGQAGNWLAQMLMAFLGLGSFWLVVLFFFFSLQLFAPKASMLRFPLIFGGCTGLIIASCGLLTAFVSGEMVLLAGRTIPAGGALGGLLFTVAAPILGVPGAILFFVALLIISLMLAMRFSPSISGRKVGEVGLELLGRLVRWLRRSVATGPRSGRGMEPAAPVFPGATTEEEGSALLVDVVPSLHEPPDMVDEEEGDEEFQPLPVTGGEYKLPGLGLLDKPEQVDTAVNREHFYEVSKQLEEKLKDYGVNGKVVGISPGPVITTYEFAPAPGVKINRIVALADDLAMGLKAESVRIAGSIPGKAALGIEIPNPERAIVQFRDIVANDNFQKSPSRLTLGLGKDVVGNPVTANLAKMPHLLIAGATGSGKSVAVNGIICSILMKATPDEVRLLLVDPKRIELAHYADIPHLLHPVVDDAKMAARTLRWAVLEMERRYIIMKEARVKNLASYNATAEKILPMIVIIIDELADLMMVSSREVEDSVTRLAQMARAAGMHLILATQRPSVDVLTGIIKANFPTRISFKVSSRVDSRTILDTGGAEHLLGMGDMLLLQSGASRMKRVHGAYISEGEIERIVSFLKEQGTAHYDESVLKIAEESEEAEDSTGEADELYDQAVTLVCETGQASISMVQRRLRIGYNRAARMVETMEKEGILGPADGSKPREVLVRKNY